MDGPVLGDIYAEKIECATGWVRLGCNRLCGSKSQFAIKTSSLR